MPILERTAPVASDDNTLAAIEAIRAALSAVVEADLAEVAVPVEAETHAAAVGVDEPAPATPAAGGFRHGKIRLHGR
jgi:hypothetical protein